QAARLAGISFRQYQRWESGQSDPRDVNLLALANAWGLPIDELRPPDPEHEEQEVRDQLDRIEAKLDAVMKRVGLDPGDLDLVEAVVEPIEELGREAAPARGGRGRAGRGRAQAAPGR